MPKPATRAERFRIIRDAIMSTLEDAPARDQFATKLSIPPFQAVYSRNRAGYGPHNLQIWPDAKMDAECGMLEHGDKVANVSWDDDDTVEIVSYRSGPWEAEIVALIYNGFPMDDDAKRLRDKVMPFVDQFGKVDLSGDVQPMRKMDFGSYHLCYGSPFPGVPSRLFIYRSDNLLFASEWTEDTAAVRATTAGTWQNDFLRLPSPAPHSRSMQ